MSELNDFAEIINIPEEPKEEIQSFLNHNFVDLLNRNQLIALTSLIYDIGLEEFIDSEIPQYLRNNKFISASNQFLHFYRNGRTASTDKAFKRKQEQLLFNLPVRQS